MTTPVGGSFATGAYDITWNSGAIGLLEGPVRLQQNVNGIPLRSTQWGDTIIDYIMRGGGCFAVIVVKEWTTAIKSFLWPYGSTLGIVDEAGKKFSDYTQSLVLTAQANTPAATLGPVTRTYANAATLPGHNLDFPLWAGPRDIVVAVGMLPAPSGGGSSRKAIFYTDT